MADTPSSAGAVLPAGAEVDPDGLVTRAAAGDRLALAQLVVRHQDRVVRLAHRLLGWRGDVEDVVQDVFATVLRNVHRFRGESRFATWLYRIAVNECRHARRKRLLRLRFWTHAAVPDPAVEPDAVARRETAEQVRAAVRGLPLRDREVVVLRYLEELPIADIGRILGLRPNAVEVRLSRARRRLDAELGHLLEK